LVGKLYIYCIKLIDRKMIADLEASGETDFTPEPRGGGEYFQGNLRILHCTGKLSYGRFDVT